MIILDRIIVKEDGEDKLITDPEAIQTETNRHFQTCAGSINEEKSFLQIGNNNTFPN